MLAVPGPGTRFAPAWPCSAWGGGAPAGGLGAQSGLESLAGSRGKEVPRLAEVGAPGLRPRGRVGASKNGDWQSGSERAGPPRPCLPIARSVQWGPLPGRTTGGWVRGHFSAERGFWAPLPATAPLAAELSVATGAPGTLSCRQGQTRCSCHVLALARVAGPSPHGLMCWYHWTHNETGCCQVSWARLLWRES